MAQEPNARVIAVANLKGGVGKSTTVLNVAGFAGAMGRRVLAVDADPQRSLSRVIAPEDTPQRSLAQAFTERATSLEGVRVASRLENVDLVPSSLALDVAVQNAGTWAGREYVLAEMLAPHLSEYDLVLIDCKPSIDLSVMNALTAARWMLVPIECSFMALDGFDHVDSLYRTLRKRINPTLDLLGILPTRYNRGTNHSSIAMDQIAELVTAQAPPLRFIPIRNATAAADAPAYSMSLAQFAPKSPVGQDYRAVTEQILAFLEGQS